MCSQYIVTQRAVNCLDFPPVDRSFADIYIVIFQNNMRLTAFNGGKHFNSEVTLSDKRDLTNLCGQTELLLMEDSHVRGKRIILRLK